MRRAFNKRRMRRQKGVEPPVTGDNIQLKGNAVEHFKTVFKRPYKAKPENSIALRN